MNFPPSYVDGTSSWCSQCSESQMHLDSIKGWSESTVWIQGLFLLWLLISPSTMFSNSQNWAILTEFWFWISGEVCVDLLPQLSPKLCYEWWHLHILSLCTSFSHLPSRFYYICLHCLLSQHSLPYYNLVYKLIEKENPLNNLMRSIYHSSPWEQLVSMGLSKDKVILSQGNFVTKVCIFLHLLLQPHSIIGLDS